MLSRGISRYQYFLAKWHARTIVVVFTFAAMALGMLGVFHFLLTDDLTFTGCLAAVVTMSALLAAVVAMGVAVGSVSNSTVVGITVLWIALYGAGLLMTLLPSTYPTPEKVLSRLPHVLQGAVQPVVPGRLGAAAGWRWRSGRRRPGCSGSPARTCDPLAFIIARMTPRPRRFLFLSLAATALFAVVAAVVESGVLFRLDTWLVTALHDFAADRPAHPRLLHLRHRPRGWPPARGSSPPSRSCCSSGGGGGSGSSCGPRACWLRPR